MNENAVIATTATAVSVTPTTAVVVLGDRALDNRIRKIKELEAQKKALEAEINSLKDEIRRDMTARSEEEHRTKNYVIRFKQIVSNSFDSKAFKAENPEMYASYLVQGSTKRLTIT